MTIDPANRPILGDPDPVQPPAPVRAAAALLLVSAVVNAGQVGYYAVVDGHELSVFLVPLGLTAFFALCVRAGYSWARPSALATAAVSALPGAGLFDGPVAAAGVLFCLAALVAVAWLVYRADVREHFTSHQRELV
jgi:hypothetical protein